ncbi:MAG TPA: hypothetical protein VMI75_12500 [Polyangiaceae bacterium]|nr:hypothetical protein [Polyangiaceae bacterium]
MALRGPYAGRHVAFDEDERNLYVTVGKDPMDPKETGSVMKVPNVER